MNRYPVRRALAALTATALAVVGLGAALQALPALATTCPAAGGSGIATAPAPQGAQFVAYGRGYGHNLGMSQYGAEGAARLGCSATQILSTYYTGTHLAAPTLQPNVMLVLLNTDLAGNATVTAESGTVKWVSTSVTPNVVAVQPLGTTWSVVRAPTGETLKDDKGAAVLTTPDNGELRAEEAAQNDGVINVARVRSFSGTTLSTDLQLKWDYTRFVSGSGGMKIWQVIVPSGSTSGIQKYLWGLAEVPVTWPDAALQAQAIAARTYLVNGYWSATSGAYVIGTTPATQNYTGYAKEVQDAQYGSHWSTAVNATAGQVVVDAGGSPIDAVYTSSHGGRSEDARYVWGGAGASYLVPVDDSTWDLASDNPNRSWAKGFTRAQLAAALGLTTVSSVTVGAPFTPQRLTGVHVTGYSGTTPVSLTYTGMQMRALLGTLSPSMVYAWLNPDLAAPVARASAGPGASFHWSATDAAPSSGLAPYTVTIAHGAVTDFDGPTTATGMTLVGAPGSTYTLTVVAHDNAGHSSAPVTATAMVPPSGTYHPTAPVRLVDTRVGLGLHLALAAHSSATVQVAGAAGSPVPSGSTVAVLNVTATGSAAPGYLSVGPAAGTGTSNVNFAPHQTAATLVTAQLSTTGTVTITNGGTGSVQVVVDAQGYFSGDATGATYLPLAPTRLVDTRSGKGVPAAVAAHGSATVQVSGAAGVPAGATAVAVNVTAVAAARPGYLSAAAALSTRTSVLNFAAGQVVANQVISQLSPTGTLTLYNGSTSAVQVLVDVAGYFVGDASGAAYDPVGPRRLLDTRASGGALPPGGNRPISVAGAVGTGVPTGATAAVLSVTAVAPAWAGYLTVGPQVSTSTSSVSFGARQVVANLVVTQLSPAGWVTVTNGSGSPAHVVVDLLGYFTA